MRISLFFFKTDLKTDTGYKYIFDQVKTLPIVDTTVDDFNNDTKFHVLRLPLLILFLLITRYFIKGTTKQKHCIVGFPKNWCEIVALKQIGYNLYLVDSVYDYYDLRLEKSNLILRSLILKICNLYEGLLLNCINNKIFLNSMYASDLMRLRNSKFADRIGYLPIGITLDKCQKAKNTLSHKYPREKKIIGMWANYRFHENRYGLECFLQRFLEQKNFGVDCQIKIAGGGLDNKFKMKFCQSEIEFLGRVSNLEEFIFNCDGLILAVERTNGIKTKLLELIQLGIPFMVKKSILSHIDLNDEIIQNALISDSYDLIAFDEFISNYSKSENEIPSIICWDEFINILQRDAA